MLLTIPMAFGPTNALTFPPESYSFDLFEIFFKSSDWTDPLFQSLKVGVASTIVAMLAGVPAGYSIARYRFAGKKFIAGLIMSPLIVPHIAIGLGLFLYF